MKNEKTLCNNEYYYTFMLNTDIWLVKTMFMMRSITLSVSNTFDNG